MTPEQAAIAELELELLPRADEFPGDTFSLPIKKGTEVRVINGDKVTIKAFPRDVVSSYVAFCQAGVKLWKRKHAKVAQ